MYHRFYSYNIITSFSDFSIEDVRYVYEQLASKCYGVPYKLYEKWDNELVKLRDYLIEKKFPYIDFLLSHFIRYKTDDDTIFTHPYLSAINNSPLKEQFYLEWVERDRLGIGDFSQYFFYSSLLNNAKVDSSFLKRFKKDITKKLLLKQATNNNLHIVTYAYYWDLLKINIEKIHAAKVSEISRHIKKDYIWSALEIIYGKRTK